MTTYSKETALYAKDEIKKGIEAAGSTATGFISEITDDGIFVHQIDEGKSGDKPTYSDAYGVHITDSVDIIRSGNVVASYGESSRIGGIADGDGNATGSRTEIDSDSVTIYSPENIPAFSVSSSGETSLLWTKKSEQEFNSFMGANTVTYSVDDEITSDVQTGNGIRLKVINTVYATNPNITGAVTIVGTYSFSISVSKGTNMGSTTKTIKGVTSTTSTDVSNISLNIAYNGATNVISISKQSATSYPVTKPINGRFNSFKFVIYGQLEVDAPAIIINDQTLKAFIIEVGTDNNWSYRKYSDGTFDAWYRTVIGAAVNTAQGSIYKSADQTLTLPSFVTGVDADDILTLTANVNGTDWVTFTSQSFGSSPNVTYNLMRGNSRTASSRTVRFYMHGILPI